MNGQDPPVTALGGLEAGQRPVEVLLFGCLTWYTPYSLVKSIMAFTFSCFASSNQMPQSTITNDVDKLFAVILYSLDTACRNGDIAPGNVLDDLQFNLFSVSQSGRSSKTCCMLCLYARKAARPSSVRRIMVWGFLPLNSFSIAI